MGPSRFATAVVPLASIAAGSNWVVNEARLKCVAPNVDFQLHQTHLEDM